MAFSGKGTKLSVGDGATYAASSTFTEIGCAYNFSGGGIGVEVITGEPCSDEDFAPKVTSTKNRKPISFTVRFSADGASTLEDLAGVWRGMKLDINGGGEIQFTGSVTDIDYDFPNGGFSEASVTVEIDGEATFAVTS